MTATAHIAHIAGQATDALQDGDCLSGITVVVAPHHGGVGCIGAYHHYLLPRLAKGQDAVVLQEYHTLARHVEGQLLVFLRGDDFRRDAFPGHKRLVVEVAQFESFLQQTFHAHVYLCLRYLAVLHCTGQRGVVATTLHIGAGEHGLGGCIARRRGNAVSTRTEEVTNGTAVTAHQPLEAPFVAENLL